MRPRVIVHNSLSLDGSVGGFPVDLSVHYGVARSLGATVHLVGSGTGLAAYQACGGGPETASDRVRPPPLEHDDRIQWVIVDSRGRMAGALHAFRNTRFGRDPIVLVCDDTPHDYLAWLEERQYAFRCVGRGRVDLPAALEIVGSDLEADTVMVDSGPGLVCALFERDLVDELSVLVWPRLSGRRKGLLDALERGLRLDLRHHEIREGVVVLRYAVVRPD